MSACCQPTFTAVMFLAMGLISSLTWRLSMPSPRRHLNLTDDLNPNPAAAPSAGASATTGSAASTVNTPVVSPIPPKKFVFVFGSNEGGIHGLGAAQYAYRNEGAVLGVGVGPRGNSYAIPTKDVRMHRGKMSVGHTLPIAKVKTYVDGFIQYAAAHPEDRFKVTQIGCGHAGLKAEDVAPLFVSAPDNCFFDTAWWKLLPGKKFWGTF